MQDINSKMENMRANNTPDKDLKNPNQLSTSISFYGSKRDIEIAREILGGVNIPREEVNARLVIQKLIDKHKLKAVIMFDGNTIWSFEKIIRNFKRIKKEGFTIKDDGKKGKIILTDYFYKFLTLSCGSIAHYDKYGWCCHYPSYNSLVEFFNKNEYGYRVLDYLPNWKADAIKIVMEIERIIKER